MNVKFKLRFVFIRNINKLRGSLKVKVSVNRSENLCALDLSQPRVNCLHSNQGKVDWSVGTSPKNTEEAEAVLAKSDWRERKSTDHVPHSPVRLRSDLTF